MVLRNSTTQRDVTLCAAAEQEVRLLGDDRYLLPLHRWREGPDGGARGPRRGNDDGDLNHSWHLDVTELHSRPQVSNDTPYSRSWFQTLKSDSVFPERFGSIGDAQRFMSTSSRDTTALTGTPALGSAPRRRPIRPRRR